MIASEGAFSLRIGLVGYGRIGRNIADALLRGEVPRARLTAVTVRHPENHPDLTDLGNLLLCETIDEAASKCDLLIEAASPQAAVSCARAAMRHGIDTMILSGCGLLGEPELLAQLEEGPSKLFIPSAALGGLDAVLAAAEDRIDEIKLTITRPVQGLEDAPFVVEDQIDLASIDQPTVLFVGNPAEACQGFPGRVNISAALALAGVGVEKTSVRIIVDPARSWHEHRIQVEGAIGRIDSALSFPASHPKGTRRAMSLSVLALLRKQTAGLRPGT